MNIGALRHMAKLLRELHADGTLVLPNAWDAASAADWSLGRPDRELLSAGQLTTESPGLNDAWLNSLFSTADLVEG